MKTSKNAFWATGGQRPPRHGIRDAGRSSYTQGLERDGGQRGPHLGQLQDGGRWLLVRSFRRTPPFPLDARYAGSRSTDGDTWWYRIISAPWDGTFYGSADAFYNNGEEDWLAQGHAFRRSPYPENVDSPSHLNKGRSRSRYNR